MSRTAASTNKQQEGGALSYWEKNQKNINRATIGSYDQSIETEIAKKKIIAEALEVKWCFKWKETGSRSNREKRTRLRKNEGLKESLTREGMKGEKASGGRKEIRRDSRQKDKDNTE